MIGYASATGTRRNLAALAASGWRLLITPLDNKDPKEFRFGLDNGAWSAFKAGRPFDAEAFARALDRWGPSADWTVVPDVVEGGLASLDLSLRWLDRITAVSPALIAVQDGMEPKDVAGLLGDRVGVFVGGSTAWKMGTMDAWCSLARARGCWAHVGRVNTKRRIRHCAIAGADSFDGTSASRYAVTLPKLDGARRQTALTLGRP